MTTCPPVPGISWAQIESRAQKISEVLFPNCDDLTKPKAMLRIFEGGMTKALGIGYGVEKLPFGEEGKYNFASNEIILDEDVYNDLHQDLGRARFTLAHEIGHGVLHSRYMQMSNGRAPVLKRADIPPFCDPESQANRFASELLLPSGLVLGHIQNGASFYQIANIFRMSHSAAKIKYDALKKRFP